MRDKREKKVTPNRLISALHYHQCWVVSWGLVAINLKGYFIGGCFLFGVGMGLSRACFSSGREQKMGANVSKGFKSERNTQRKRAERERKAEGELGKWGGGGCAQSSPGFSPEFHSSDAQVLRK